MEDYNNYEDQQQPAKSIKGYKIVIIILALILAALSFLYFQQTNSMKKDFQIEKDTLTNRLSAMMMEYDNIKTENDTISQNLAIERDKADSLFTQLNKERNFSRAKIREYEKKLGTMTAIMRNFVKQVDSLNTLNKTLITQNVEIRKQVSTERLRADKAEEKADELTTKVRKGAVIRARSISLQALSNNDKEVTRAGRAARLRVDFALVGNELATPGERNVYARITGPDGYIMANASNATFDYEGDRITYSATREVDYQNQDLNVSLYYNGSGIVGGKYKVAIYIDGYLIGSNEIVLK